MNETSAAHALNFLASVPNGRTSVSREILREIMLSTSGEMMACGRLYEIHAKSLGAGVYRLTLHASRKAAGEQT